MSGRRKISLCIGGVLLAVSIGALLMSASAPRAVAAGVAAEQEKIEIQKDIVYGKSPQQELKLNLALPQRASVDDKRPCILVIHGGGWRGGNKDQHNNIIEEFARRGYVSATIGYRLVPTAQFPAQVNDVKCAVRFLRENATKYGIDADHIGAIGFSAGAHLSMMLAVCDEKDGLEGDGGHADQSSKIHAAVSYFGPTDMARDDLPAAVTPIIKDFLGEGPSKTSEVCKKASPITYVTKGDAPMLLFQGTSDPLVPYTQALAMADAMAKAQIPGRVEVIMNAGHGWGDPELHRTAEASFAFFEQQLKKMRRN